METLVFITLLSVTLFGESWHPTLWTCYCLYAQLYACLCASACARVKGLFLGSFSPTIRWLEASKSFSAGFNILIKVFFFFFNLRNMIIKLCSIVCSPHVIKSTCLHCPQCWSLRWSFYPITCQLACVARFNDDLPEPRFSSCRAKLLQWWITVVLTWLQVVTCFNYKRWIIILQL